MTDPKKGGERKQRENSNKNTKHFLIMVPEMDCSFQEALKWGTQKKCVIPDRPINCLCAAPPPANSSDVELPKKLDNVLDEIPNIWFTSLIKMFAQKNSSVQ